jgi:transcriptional regulator with XRE-family HTH domain
MTEERVRRLLAKRVQALRLSRGLTQEDMRDHGFGYRHYQRIEAGEKDLRLTTLTKLSNALKVTLKDLFDFE